MALPIVEIAGILLIVAGLLIIIFKLSGKLTAEDTGGEISSKLFTLKGGTGLVLIALGIVVLMGGYILQPSSSEPSPVPTGTQTHTPTSPDQTFTPVPTTVQTFTPIPTVVQTFTPVPTAPAVTDNYLVGTWSSVQGSLSETIIFYFDGSFYLEDYDFITTQSVYFTGFYYVSDSNLYLEVSGVPTRYSLTYVDQNTFRLGPDIYQRII